MKRRLIEGYWDCPYCDTEKIRGGVQECPNCGRTRNENTTFYLSGEHNYVAPQMTVAINRKQNWICPYCDSLNSDDDSNCRSCAAPRTSRNLKYFENKERKQESRPFENKEKKQESRQFVQMRNDEEATNSSKHLPFDMRILKYVGIGLFSLLAIIGLIYLFTPQNKEITISQMSWKRSIDIQRYQTVEESGWELPANARLLYSQLEFSHYEKVLDHYETKTKQVPKERIKGYEDYVVGIKDLGNGYFEEIIGSRPVYETYYVTETYEEPVYRNEAVYRTKYYYEVDKWLYERTETSSGFDKEPYWCEVTLASDERVSLQREFYYVDGTDEDGKVQHYTMSYNEWISIEVGQTVTFEVSIFGDATIVNK